MATATKSGKKIGGKRAAKAKGGTPKASGVETESTIPRAKSRPKGSEGMVRNALLAEIEKQGISRSALRNKSGVPGTSVFEYLRTDGKGKRASLSLRNAEALLHALGMRIVPGNGTDVTASAK